MSVMGEMHDKQTLDCMIRVLWALVDRAGGSITISDQEAGPVTGQVRVNWADGQITVSVGQGTWEMQ